jgi:hemoglobin
MTVRSGDPKHQSGQPGRGAIASAAAAPVTGRPNPPVTEEQIAELVRSFYESAFAHEDLGPIFHKAIADWDGHLAKLTDFWSHFLLKTNRYQGRPFPFHLDLPIEPQHFDQWLALFIIAADASLPPEAAKRAKARAAHMAEAFRTGLFPYVGANGEPSRVPPKRP